MAVRDRLLGEDDDFPDTGGHPSAARCFTLRRSPVEDRINAAYSFAGIHEPMSALQSYTRVPVEHYVVVDFEGFRDVVNAMGGVEVDVEDEIPPKYAIEEGLQTLNGSQTLFYARYRGTPGGLRQRIEHQQVLIAALGSEALGWHTVAKRPEISRVMNRNVETNLGFEKAIALARLLLARLLRSRGREAEMTSAQLPDTPTTLPNWKQVLVSNEEANETVLAEFRY